MSVCQMKIPGLLGSLYLFSVPQLGRSSAGIVSRSFGSTLRVLWPGHSGTVTAHTWRACLACKLAVQCGNIHFGCLRVCWQACFTLRE